MENQKSIDALNKLVEINNDRVEGYETASKETTDADLKSLFAGLQATSQDNLSELHAEVTRLGGKPEDGTRITGKFFRAWMDVKAALAGNERKAILESCEFGEDKALEVYEDVLENANGNLSDSQRQLATNQQQRLRADHDRVKALRDAQ
ncbi:PA2169 family four-helix-bundle protein [Flavobacterium sp. NST-5]|uniref:PA2169 family four-helix-bundle protein n=1 Tax=Flavobacterium ichthyis TaxID=2698827 RepID=A0ABW9Z647_9FLAO|nr:PA2169 family four-helix-bundle protein [Flavobacterium ichthyis]NBL63590.1 PA2169 family four-helix-bundle protein [Flavobacterium ichthyis]